MDPLGYGLNGYGAGEYGFVEDDSNEPEPMPTCKGTKTNGDPCTLPAGWGTDSDTYCMYHEDQSTDDTDGGSDGGGDDTMTQSPLYSTDDTNAADRIIVAETAADIQPAIDYCANNDIRGTIQLLPRTYTPSQQIELKGTVVLRGVDSVNVRGPSSPTTIQADNIADGNAVIRYRTNDEPHKAKASQVRNLQIRGQRDDGVSVHGIEVGFIGNPIIANCIVWECERHGIVFSGTQSGEIHRSFIGRCGDAANDWHGLDCGSVVGSPDDLNRTTVIGSVFVENGPKSDAAPLKLRNGSTLKIKPSATRTGVRVHGGSGIEDTDEPGIDLDGGNLIADNITVTANLESLNAGIIIRNNGSLTLRNSTAEKCDPNIRMVRGSMSLSNTEVNQAKDWGNGGNGIHIRGNQPGKMSQLSGVDLLRNKGHGVVLGDGAVINPIWYDVRTENNGGYGIDGRGSNGATVVGMWRKDDDGHANELGMYAGENMIVDYLSAGNE